MVVKQRLSKGACTSFLKHVSLCTLLFSIKAYIFLTWLVEDRLTPLRAEDSYQIKSYLLLCHGIGGLRWDRD